MKKIFFSIILLSLFSITYANNKEQQKWIKEVAKSVFTLKTFDKNNFLLQSSTGFFVGENGEAICSYAPFKNAYKAIIIDSNGKENNVDYIIGANETYDVIKFHVNIKKAIPLTISGNTQNDSSEVLLIPYSPNKKVEYTKGKITKTELFKEQYIYYTIALNSPFDGNCCPLFNSDGEVLGLTQESSSENTKLTYAVSASFANDLKTNGLSINDPALKNTYIKKALPDTEDQAILALYLGSKSLDSLNYVELVDDYIKKFPNSHEGYIHKAQIYCDAKLFEKAEEYMNLAKQNSSKPEDVHYSYAKMIFGKELYFTDIQYDNWNLDKAIAETDMAYSINPLPTYKQLKGQILFTQAKYDESYQIYKQITDSGTKTAELFIEQARCMEMLNDTTKMLALLDSAINTYSKPYLREVAPYLLIRAQALTSNKQYRKAVVDYNDYEKLMGETLNANFYYIRYQCELEGKLYQLALNDINKAININPKEPLYYAEKSSLEIRVNLIDDAITTARNCIAEHPQYSDGYLFLGLALCIKGQKVDGIANLKKALELGNNQAQILIEKYK